jgi:hypothetical protein
LVTKLLKRVSFLSNRELSEGLFPPLKYYYTYAIINLIIVISEQYIEFAVLTKSVLDNMLV